MRVHIVGWTGDVPGYGDARWDGRYAVSVPGLHVDTDRGIIPQPAGGSRFLRVCPIGLRVACATQDNPSTALEWNGAASWVPQGPACGNRPVIYDAAGQLVVAARCDDVVGATGWRFVALNPITLALGRSFKTFNAGALVPSQWSQADPGRGVWEFTDYGDVVIGQGSPTGLLVRFSDEGKCRVVTAKDTAGRPVLDRSSNVQFVNVSRNSSAFAITAVDLTKHRTVIWWGTLAELRAMPLLDMAVPVPVPVPLAAPVVTVDRFDGIIRKGTEWHFTAHDGNNPDIKIDVMVNAEGSMHLTLTHRGGTARTGKTRIVVE